MKKVNWGLIFILLLIFALRIPTFTEPYWYGDEGIYLVLGQAVQRGAVLYRDIWDNKTPLLYWIYAIYPTLLWAKISATLFVLGTVVGIYKLVRTVIPTREPESSRYFLDPGSPKASGMTNWIALLTSLVTGLFLSLPLLEGTIANAELYFTLPIVWGGYFIYKNIVGAGSSSPTNAGARTAPLQGIIIGLLLFVAFLLKVPAIFDFIGMFLYITIIYFSENKNNYYLLFKKLIDYFSPITFIFFTSLVLLVLYFYFNSALKDFITAAFLQNSSYVAIDSGPLSKLSNPLFIRGFLALLASLVLLVLFIKNKVSKELLFLNLWFIFSLYGSLLSNRPYMHYLLQIVPPLIILFIYLLFNIKKYFLFVVPLFITLYSIFNTFQFAFFLPIKPYYENWFRYVSNQQSWENYVNFFDSRTLNSYRIANYLKANSSKLDPIFVWGDAAFIYVLSERPPATKFIQAHHLTTIDPSNYDLIIQNLKDKKPKFIIMKTPPRFPFPKLEELLKMNYKYVTIFDNMEVYQIR